MGKNILLIAGITLLIFLFLGCPKSPGKPDTSPGEVLNLSALVSVFSSQVTLTWINPADTDFNYCEVWYGKGASTDTEFSGAVDAEETIITDLIYGESYSFKVIAVDLTGNKSNATEINIQLVETKLTASDGAADDYYGISVSISSDGATALVGAYMDDNIGTDFGSVYIYKWNGSAWAETKLTASDGAVNDWFGSSVDISADGSSIIVGAPQDGDNGGNSGSAYIYKWNGSTWAETKLTASDGASLDYYGNSVGISSDGSTVVVGAREDDNNGIDSGSVYIYKWNGSTWVETNLTASDGSASDYFGVSVSTSSDGNTILVGAFLGDGNVVNSGSAYIYNWNGSVWAETKLTASDGTVDDRFGSSVSISSDGTTVLVGAPEDDNTGTNSGSVYTYKWNGSAWVETKLTALDGAAGDYFGGSLSISSDGTTVLAGAYSDDDNGTNSGSAYKYTWNGSAWVETKLTALDGAAGDYFGGSLNISSDGTTVLAGAYFDNDNGTNSGSVYIYK